MFFKPIILFTDFLAFMLVACILAGIYYIKKSPPSIQTWRRVLSYPSGMISLILMLFFSITGLLDCLHYSTAEGQIHSVLDWILSPMGQHYEKTYSEPLAITLYNREYILNANGSVFSEYPHLIYAAKGFTAKNMAYYQDIFSRISVGLIVGMGLWLMFANVWLALLARYHKAPYWHIVKKVILGQTVMPWRAGIITLLVISCAVAISYFLGQQYYVFGTDQVGNDVLYESIKSIRTGLLIGSLTTLVMLPFALFMGTMAGYFGGWLDDVIQYIYTTLSSIPGVLLVAASVLSIQIYIDNHPYYFEAFEVRADARLLALCVILGITSWTALCRVLRAETLKIRELDYILAARVMGSHWITILVKHVFPNVFHIILISTVLDFSTLVLAEAVLTYVGVGVDPTTSSWGNIINSARLELAREPVVWWPLASAFLFMFLFVLAANLLADAVRNGFDPKLSNQA